MAEYQGDQMEQTIGNESSEGDLSPTNFNSAKTNLSDFSASGKGQIIEIQLSNGQTYHIHPQEYQTVLKNLRETALAQFKEAQILFHGEQQKAFVQQWTKTWKVRTL
jgi:hypothetical protein